MSSLKASAWLVSGLLSAACHDSRPAAAPADSCQRWAAEACKRLGEESEPCDHVKETIELLTADTCAAALANPAALTAYLGRRTRACSDLRTRLCSEIGTHTRACKTATEQSAKFDPDRCLAMLGNFAEVKKNLAEAYQPLRLSQENVAKLQNPKRPERGPKDGKLQLTEFLDYEDHGSAEAAAALRVLADKYGDQLRITIRMFPLEAHPNARLAAEAAFAAHDQGKFWEMHDVLLANQKALDRASLEQYAKQLQLDLDAFKTALDKHTYARDVDADLALVQELKITAMPAMIMNGEHMLDGTNPQSLLDAAEEFLATPND